MCSSAVITSFIILACGCFETAQMTCLPVLGAFRVPWIKGHGSLDQNKTSSSDSLNRMSLICPWSQWKTHVLWHPSLNLLGPKRENRTHTYTQSGLMKGAGLSSFRWKLILTMLFSVCLKQYSSHTDCTIYIQWYCRYGVCSLLICIM